MVNWLSRFVHQSRHSTSNINWPASDYAVKPAGRTKQIVALYTKVNKHLASMANPASMGKKCRKKKLKANVFVTCEIVIGI